MITNKLLTGATVAAGFMTILSSCGDTFDPSSTSDRQGRILVSVGLDKEVAAPQAMSKASATDADVIDVSDLKLRLSSVDGEYTQTWNSVDEMPVSAEYPVGGYKLEAFYGEENAEGFNKPYYYGSQALTVLENRSTPVSLTASLANSMVTVVYTDAVKDYFASISGEVESSTGLKTVYAVDETRPVYVKPGSTTVSVDVTKQSGVSAKLSPVTFNAEPRHHYTVTFDVNGGETGKGTLTVTFNSDLDTKEEIIDLSDEILTAPAPTISLSGFQSAETLTFVEGSNGENLRATIVAQAGLGTVVMTTSSASLLGKGWPAEVDFAAADAATLAKLRELGLQFHGLEGTLTQIALLDFSNVVSHIAYMESGDNITEINFVAKDKITKASEPASFKVEIEKLSMEVVNVEPLEPDQTELTVDVSYNGNDFEQGVGFQVRNERNTWENVAPVSVTPLSRTASVYRVVLPVAADGNVVFRVVRGEMMTEEKTVNRNVIGAVINDNDVFATHAALVLTDDGAVAEGTQLFLSTDGVTFAPATATASGNTLVFSGLNPGTSYVAKVEKDGMRSKKLPFTTEAATQLPNAGFDEWASEQKGDYQYLWTITNSSWATLNPLTLSNNGSGSGNGLNTGGCAYKATSGTIPANGRSTQSTAGGGFWGTEKHSDGHTEGNATLHSDKQRSGANAALVRTVGWGSGNAAASSSGFGTCQNATAGELFLGVCQDNSPVYGYAFASRPSNLSFYYRYEVVSAGNGDFGTAEISVLDKDGNVIATADKVLGEQSAYTRVEMPLTYTSKEKAAQIRVIFRSSGFDGALSNKNTTFWHKPGSKNTSGGEFVGSELYIDDVVLNYN